MLKFDLIVECCQMHIGLPIAVIPNLPSQAHSIHSNLNASLSSLEEVEVQLARVQAPPPPPPQPPISRLSSLRDAPPLQPTRVVGFNVGEGGQQEGRAAGGAAAAPPVLSPSPRETFASWFAVLGSQANQVCAGRYSTGHAWRGLTDVQMASMWWNAPHHPNEFLRTTGAPETQAAAG